MVLAALALLGGLALSATLRLLYPHSPAVEQLSSGHTEAVEMPWRFWEATSGDRLLLQLQVNPFTSRVWTIIPDDHLAVLRINGQAVPIDKVPLGGLNDWRNGFKIDLSPWLHNGSNELEFVVDNYLGVGGIVFRPVLGWRRLLVFGALLPWLVLLARAFRLNRVQIVILCGSLAVLCCYWSATSWTSRNYDVKLLGESGHIGYVETVAEALALPRPDQGWEYFQPPLYYVAGALVWRWAQWLGINPPEGLQAFAVILWLVFLTASAGTLRLALRRRPDALAVATAAVGLWPDGVINSARIGNDSALCAGAAVASWFMLRWWRSGKRSHFVWMAVFIAASLLCKSSAMVLVAACGGLLAVRLLSNRRRLRVLTDAALAGGIIAAGMVLSLGRNVYYWSHGRMANILDPSVAILDANLRVPNSLRNYLPLDVPVFLSMPWVDSRDDATGRTNFWNYLLRSSLSGEFSFDGTWHRRIAIFWGVALLWLVVLVLVRLFDRPFPLAASWRNMPLTLLGALWLLSILTLRFMHPFSCHQDFRLVYPLLVPFILLCVRQGQMPQRLLWAISLGSAAFFVSL